MSDIIERFIVKTNNNILYHASVGKFVHSLIEFINQSEIENQTIYEAIEAVFRRQPTKILAKSVLVSYTVAQLNAQPENFLSLRTKVLSYIKNNSSGEHSKLIIKAGKKGGVSLRN